MPQVAVTEFGPLPRYRTGARVAQSTKTSKRHLDVREYVEATTFTTFTRLELRLALDLIHGLSGLVLTIREMVQTDARREEPCLPLI